VTAGLFAWQLNLVSWAVMKRSLSAGADTRVLFQAWTALTLMSVDMLLCAFLNQHSELLANKTVKLSLELDRVR
jgi:hypothetical protein